uniref:Uncharacterized protein n=1 Tax=Plectus sambesii TaxID=2011161 RepID=A0A914UMI6_9BILA
MLGVVVFSGRDEVVYVNGNAPMRAKLLLKQAEFSTDSSTSGYSEMGSSADRLSSSPPPLDKVSGKKSADFDLNALTQYFLPLVVMYRAKEELDGDPYRHIKVHGMQLLFHAMRERFIMVVIMSSPAKNTEKMRRFLKDVAAAFSLHFGPLLSLFSSSQWPMKSCRRKLNRAVDEIVANFDHPSLDNHQWLARCVDVCAYSYSTQSPLARELAVVANELQLFLGISHCLVISNRQLLAAHSTPLAKNGSTVQVLPVRDILLLLRSGSQSSSRPPRTKPKCQHAWLCDSTSTEKRCRTLWDIFRVEIVAGTELICAGESNCAPLVSKIATLIDTLRLFLFDHRLESIVRRHRLQLFLFHHFSERFNGLHQTVGSRLVSADLGHEFFAFVAQVARFLGRFRF